VLELDDSDEIELDEVDDELEEDIFPMLSLLVEDEELTTTFISIVNIKLPNPLNITLNVVAPDTLSIYSPI